MLPKPPLLLGRLRHLTLLVSRGSRSARSLSVCGSHPDMLLALALAAAQSPQHVALGFMCKQFDRQSKLGPNKAQVDAPCPGWLYGMNGVLHRRSNWAKWGDEAYNFSLAARAAHSCFLHDDVWFAGHMRSRGIVPHLISPGFTSATSLGGERPTMSSYVVTNELRRAGIDPELACARSFCAL